MSFMDPTPARYAIRIHGHPGATMLSTFPALASRRHGADTVLTALLDASALWGVLAEIEALGLDLVRSASSPRTANQQNHVTAGHQMATTVGRTELGYLKLRPP